MVLPSVSDSRYCITSGTLVSHFTVVFLEEELQFFFTLSHILSCDVADPVHISTPWQHMDAGCYEGHVLLGQITESLPYIN